MNEENNISVARKALWKLIKDFSPFVEYNFEGLTSDQIMLLNTAFEYICRVHKQLKTEIKKSMKKNFILILID
jgi:hypothetical protein